jgi:hypothetical protein
MLSQSLRFKRTLLILIAFASASCAFGQAIAQPKAERKYEIHVCQSPLCSDEPLPLKITEVRNLQSERWWQDLEIEVRNISDKPIYAINLIVSLPDTKPLYNITYGTPLKYGRYELFDISNRADANDRPLNSGETYIFKIPEKFWPTFERPPVSATLNVEIKIQSVFFGDGTGLSGSGVPLPNKRTSHPTPYYRIVL